jgi:hypothetical protein
MGETYSRPALNEDAARRLAPMTHEYIFQITRCTFPSFFGNDTTKVAGYVHENHETECQSVCRSNSSATSTTSSGRQSPTPPPTPDAAAASDSIATAARAVSGFSNPGPYEQAINDVKRIVMVDTFEGFRCDISKQVVRKCVVGMLVPTWPCRCNQKMCIVQTSMVSFPNKYRHCLFLVSINVPNFRLYTPMLWDNWG